MTDDRPLSSDEMIRQAREQLSVTPEPLYPDAVEPMDDSDFVDDPLPIETATRKSRPRTSRRHNKLPPDPFASRERPLTPQAKARALAIFSGIAMLLLGIGVAVALFASTTP